MYLCLAQQAKWAAASSAHSGNGRPEPEARKQRKAFVLNAIDLSDQALAVVAYLRAQVVKLPKKGRTVKAVLCRPQ